jgi:hypothetical protein
VALHPLPRQAVVQCRLAQASTRVPLLCPRRVPLPTLPTPYVLPQALPTAAAERLPAMGRGAGRESVGVSFGYGAPWEPSDVNPAWRQRLWANRPCCFLHLEVFRWQRGRADPPPQAVPATLGGRRGLYAPALSLGMGCRGNGGNFCNHAAFFFRAHGVRYVVTLHHFAPLETRALLARLVAELVPARSLALPR